jgi:hypothetical protein
VTDNLQLETIDVSWAHNPCPIPGRHVEEGILLIPEKLYFSLCFEGFPMWILALNWTLVMEVNFLDWAGPGERTTAMTSQGHNVSLLNAAIAHIGLSRVQFGKPSRPSLVWLVSGSSSFLAAYMPNPSQPTLLLLSGHYQAKRVAQTGLVTWI